MGETEGAGEESSGQAKVAEYEAAEASRRGWFFCGCRQVLVIADRERQRRRERSAAVAGENRKLRVGVGVSWGGGPLGASGERRVSGPRQRGQRSAAIGSMSFTASRFSLPIGAASNCLACWSSLRLLGLS